MKGDEKTDAIMVGIHRVIERHIKFPSSAFTEIYNRVYEVVEGLVEENERLVEQNKRLKERVKE